MSKTTTYRDIVTRNVQQLQAATAATATPLLSAVITQPRSAAVKLQTESLAKFSGSRAKWSKWYLAAIAYSGLSGLDKVLTSRENASANPDDNKKLYYMLHQTLQEGTAFWIVKQHAKEKDGYAVWNDLKADMEG